jgi:hypothetical protein
MHQNKNGQRETEPLEKKSKSIQQEWRAQKGDDAQKTAN